MSKPNLLITIFLCQVVLGWIAIRFFMPNQDVSDAFQFHATFCLGILMGYFHCWRVKFLSAKEEDANSKN